MEQVLHRAGRRSGNSPLAGNSEQSSDAMQQSDAMGPTSSSVGVSGGATSKPHEGGQSGSSPVLMKSQASSSASAAGQPRAVPSLLGMLKPSGTIVDSSRVTGVLAPGSEALRSTRSADNGHAGESEDEDGDTITSGRTGSGSTSASETIERAMAAASNGILPSTPMRSRDHQVEHFS